MIKDRYKDTDLYIVEGELKNVRLLQSKLAKLSTFKSNEGAIKSITNCSFYTTSYVLGRDQGDERNNTYGDSDNGKLCDVVIKKDGTYKYGKFNNWDYVNDVVCGFSAGAFLIANGQDCDMFSEALNVESIIKSKHPRTAFAILKNGKCLQFVSEGRTGEDGGLTGYEVRDYLKSKYDIELLAILDGGKSTELIVDKKIVNQMPDGEQSMLNGLAFIEKQEELKLKYPCASGWDSQEYKTNVHYGLDFGWIRDCSDDILSCADGEVTFEGYYDDVIGGKAYKPIGCIIKHSQFSNEYDYYSLYTHLASTIVNKGQIVKAGEKIGVKGNTGYSAGKHLHFQFMRMPKGQPLKNWNTNAINPTPYLYRTSDQIFEYRGNFDIPLVDDVIEQPQEQPNDYNNLLIDYRNLETEYNSLQVKYNDKEKENEELSDRLVDMERQLDEALKKIEDIKEVLG